MGNLAIIPARSGSKGVKDKNIKILKGKPLIAYTIDAAYASGMFEQVMVSTDSDKYAEIARYYGAVVPFLRDKKNALDETSSWEVVKEVLTNLEQMGKKFDTFALLQPTSPLRDGEDIQHAYKIFNDKMADAVVSVCEMEHSPLWCNILPSDNCLANFLPKKAEKRRQDLEKYYRINGAIYISKVEKFLNGHSLYGKNGYAMIMETYKSIDIDNSLDFVIAEAILNTK